MKILSLKNSYIKGRQNKFNRDNNLLEIQNNEEDKEKNEMENCEEELIETHNKINTEELNPEVKQTEERVNLSDGKQIPNLDCLNLTSIICNFRC